jgi:murein DD-endopeptidase MepM/ murein hydrolase activator NlpD
MLLRWGGWISFFWTLVGACCFASLPYFYFSGVHHYELEEPFYTLPVLSPGGGVPIRSDSYGKGYFGAQRNNGRIHKGIDITIPVGQPVTAAKSGRVVVAGVDKGYGNWIEVLHPDGLNSRYAHLQKLMVSPGQWVSVNQLIGYSGKTGNAINPHIVPHLHFEIRYKDHALNPFDGLLNPVFKPAS